MRQKYAEQATRSAIVAVFTVAVLIVHDMPPWTGWETVPVSPSLVCVLALILCLAWEKYREFGRNKWSTLAKSLAGGLIVTAMYRHWSLAIMAETAMYMVLMLAPAVAVAFVRKRQHDTLAARLRDDAERERMARELAEAQLRLLRTPLKDLLASLDPGRFWQVHRATVVNVAAIEAAERLDAERLQLLLRGSAEKPIVSRAFTHLFRV